jgi:MFS family permease
MIDKDLKQMEQSTFMAAADSGLWDIFLASVVAMFAIAPLLSSRLGDLWSVVVFLPVWAVVLIINYIISVRVVRPRIGVVKFAKPRIKRMMSMTIIMLAVNVAALVFGIVAATRGVVAGQPSFLMIIGPSISILIGSSFVAFFLGIPRVFAYGLLLAGAFPIGEMLFRRGYASHHGYPVVFGISAIAILVSGIVRFVSFLPRRQAEGADPLSEGNHE